MTITFDNGDPWLDRLSEYLDGSLTEPEREALEEHLRVCESCRTALAELRTVVERLHADQMDEIPDDAWPRIAARLDRGQVPSRLGARGRVSRSSGVLEAATLRRITTAASLTLTLVGGIWVGASLCLARSVWTPPAWMPLWPRGGHISVTKRRSSVSVPEYAGDSVLDAWTPLRRSLAALDQQLADAAIALRSQPNDKSLARVVVELTRERRNLQATLDSAVSSSRPARPVPPR